MLIFLGTQENPSIQVELKVLMSKKLWAENLICDFNLTNSCVFRVFYINIVECEIDVYQIICTGGALVVRAVNRGIWSPNPCFCSEAHEDLAI